MLIVEDDQNSIPEWARRQNEKLLMISHMGTVLGNGSDQEGELIQCIFAIVLSAETNHILTSY